MVVFTDKEHSNLTALRASIYQSEGINLLEDAVGGYLHKKVAFIGCNPHAEKSNFLEWINSRSDSIELKSHIADLVPTIKCKVFKDLTINVNPIELLALDPLFKNIHDDEFLSYLKFLARSDKNQFHYNIAKYFKEILGLSDLSHSEVYQNICKKSIFLEIWKIGSATEKEIPLSVKPQIDLIEKQLTWLLANGLAYIVLIGNKAHKFKDVILSRIPPLASDFIFKVPSFSPMPAAAKKWRNCDTILKESLARIWAI